MKNVLLPVLAVLLIFTSCNDDSEVEPVVPYVGIYQYIDTLDTLNYVKTIELREGDKFISQGTVRNRGESHDLGFTYFSTGTYSVEGDTLIISTDFSSLLEDRTNVYVAKEDLTIMEDLTIESPFVEPRYWFTDNYTKIRVSSPCPPNAYCVGGRLPVYNKVSSK